MSGARPPAGFLSGDTGDVMDLWRRVKRRVGEAAFELTGRALLVRSRTVRLGHRAPARRVLVLGVYRPGSLLPGEAGGLRSEHHEVTLALGATDVADPLLAEHTVATRLAGGKFENLNRLLGLAGGREPDWTVVVDDDVRLPAGFLDSLIGVCEWLGLDLAQPAQTQMSHSAWRVTRRRPASLARETRFVEIGPVTAFSRRAAAELLPFPELRYGWGLDLHWAALAAEHGWRLGVVDALPVRHEWSTVAGVYSRAEAEAEAAAFLSGRPYLPAARAGDVLAIHRRAGPRRKREEA